MTPSRDTDVLIVGGGLAGLRLADLLAQAGRDYLLIETRNRLGGRILCHSYQGAAFDLGPAWFWPGQPRMAALIERFRLDAFEQYATGDIRVEDPQGVVRQGRGPGGMQGSLRLAGGMAVLTDALSQGLPQDRILLDTGLLSVAQTATGIIATTTRGVQITARRIIFALPPRLVAQFDFSPPLSAEVLHAMAAVPTWMAGQAKAVALFDTAFWRKAGLSGDAMSHRGPLVEIHDATPLHGGPAALFGFIGVGPTHRRDRAALEAAIIAQLIRLFGRQAATPLEVVIRDWAVDQATATEADQAPMTSHPRYGLPPGIGELWDGRIAFGGSEVACEFGGYLEGALHAAETAFDAMLPSKRMT